MSIIAAVVFLLVLPSPWNLLAFATCMVLAIGEVGFWQRKVRDQRRVVDAEAMLGTDAIVLTPCKPYGQVRVDGEIWGATCEDRADPGEHVLVVGRQRLQLLVTPQDRVSPRG
jgi:membrane protein implicated in regulation of membrane protease activity